MPKVKFDALIEHYLATRCGHTDRETEGDGVSWSYAQNDETRNTDTKSGDDDVRDFSLADNFHRLPGRIWEE